ncbi:MAG: hypothetical protein ACLQJR_03220 [Stellaceae bacterium]
MIPLSRILACCGASALLALAAAGPAVAGDQTQPLGVDGSGLVRGGAPLPDFRLNFLPNDPVSQGLNPAGGSNNLEIALTSPGTGVFHFLFSPRPQLGFGLDRMTGVNRGYAGLSWSLFDNDRLFGSVGLGGTYDPGSNTPFDQLRRPLGPPLMMRGALEFGYQFGDQHSLSLRLDEGRPADLRLNGENSDNLQLRYGVKF